MRHATLLSSLVRGPCLTSSATSLPHYLKYLWWIWLGHSLAKVQHNPGGSTDSTTNSRGCQNSQVPLKMARKIRQLLRKQQLLGHPGVQFEQDPSGNRFSSLGQGARFTRRSDHVSSQANMITARSASPPRRLSTPRKRKAVDEREEPFKRRKQRKHGPTTTETGYEASTPTISETASPDSGAEADAVSQALERLNSKLDALEEQQKHARRKENRRHSSNISQFEELGNAQATARVAFEEHAASLATHQRQVDDSHHQMHTNTNKQIEELRTAVIDHDLRISTQDGKIATNSFQVKSLVTRVDLMDSASQARSPPPFEAKVDYETFREVQESVRVLEQNAETFDFHGITLEVLRHLEALEERADTFDSRIKKMYEERSMNDDAILERRDEEARIQIGRSEIDDSIGDRHERTLIEHEKAHTCLSERVFHIEQAVLPDLIEHGPRIEKLERAAATIDKPQPPPMSDLEVDIQTVADHGHRIEKLEQANCTRRIEKLEEADHGRRIGELEQAAGKALLDGNVGNETQDRAKLDVGHELETLREVVKSQNETIRDLRVMLDDHQRLLEEGRRALGQMKADIFGYPYNPT